MVRLIVLPAATGQLFLTFADGFRRRLHVDCFPSTHDGAYYRLWSRESIGKHVGHGKGRFYLGALACFIIFRFPLGHSCRLYDGALGEVKLRNGSAQIVVQLMGNGKLPSFFENIIMPLHQSLDCSGWEINSVLPFYIENLKVDVDRIG